MSQQCELNAVGQGFLKQIKTIIANSILEEEEIHVSFEAYLKTQLYYCSVLLHSNNFQNLAKQKHHIHTDPSDLTG